jgi:hypothetical protein
MRRNQMKKILATLAASSMLMSGAYAAPTVNVASGAAVTLVGNGFGDSSNWGSSGSPGTPGSVVDGAYYNVGHQWNIGTIYWTSYDSSSNIEITLAQPANVTSLFLQSDANDQYQIQYRGTDQQWHHLATLAPPLVWGLGNASTTLPSAVTATGFKIIGTGGDHFYAVSEFQALGTIAAVPEPSTYAMLGLGLGLLTWRTGRRRVR